jgi:hypothetical protein
MKRARLARAVPISVALSAAWSALHCTTSGLDRARGQSGSEVVSNGGTGGTPGGEGTDGTDGTIVPACPCGRFPTSEDLADQSRAAARLRVTLLEQSPAAFDTGAFSQCRAGAPAEPGCARVRLRVEEVLEVANAALEVGAELVAFTDGALPCGLGAARVPVGQQALANIGWLPSELPACEEREQCVDQCESEYDAQVAACQQGEGACPDTTATDTCEHCIDDFAGVCPSRPPISNEDVASRGNVRLTLWEEQIVFAANEQGELRVPANELSALSSEECHERFGNWSDLPGAFPNGTP